MKNDTKDMLSLQEQQSGKEFVSFTHNTEVEVNKQAQPLRGGRLGICLNPFMLPSVPLEDRHFLPSKPGLYFVIDGEDLLYIGRSKNLNTRWRGHHRREQITSIAKNPVIAYLDVSDSALLWVERTIIIQFKPLLNDTKISSSSKSSSSQAFNVMPEQGKTRKDEDDHKEVSRMSQDKLGWDNVEEKFEAAFFRQCESLQADAARIRNTIAKAKRLEIANADQALEICVQLDMAIRQLSSKDTGADLSSHNPFQYPADIEGWYEESLLHYYREKYPKG